MNTTTRLVAYGGLLAATIAGAAGLGSAVGPIDTVGAAVHDVPVDHDGSHGPGSTPETSQRSGTSLDADGFRLDPERRRIAAGRSSVYSFRIVDRDGVPVTDVVTRHERELHLIVASRDLERFHHLHPIRDEHGTWTVELPPLEPATYRVYADLQPLEADPITLGVDLFVTDEPGDGVGHADDHPTATNRDEVDGYLVTLVEAASVGDAALRFAVERNGSPIATEPYLGAAGHLVVLRAGDLAYVHAHAKPVAGGEASSLSPMTFDVDFPSAGAYQLFLDFAVDGRVHTATFTVLVPDTAETPSHTAPSSHGDH